MYRATLLLCALSFGCDGPAAPADAEAARPIILTVLAPTPVLEGSILEVRGLGLEVLGSAPELAFTQNGAARGTLSAVPDDGEQRLLFTMSSELVAALGVGEHEVEVTARGNGIESEPFSTHLTIADSLAVELTQVPTGEVFRNDVAVVIGAGFLVGSEGSVDAHFVGTFLRDDNAAQSAIDVALPIAPLERNDRTRGVVVLSTDLGGLWPGTFTGTIKLVSVLRSGARSESAMIATSLHFGRPALFDVQPRDASLGRILDVRGGGFLGGADRPTETTLILLAGSFTPAASTVAEPVGPIELVPRFVSGSEVELVIEPEVRGETLVSALFGHARGTFMGTATPITIAGVDEVRGDPTPFAFTIGPILQVVHVRFLPGFYDSLRHFGLAAAAPEITQQVIERIDGIYNTWNIDLRLEEPDDFAPTAYSLVEIGGADPNGVGLFGYDNTPGKDVGNLRLFDSIGGTNAQTQMDGYPGYGGVFVESMLYWSSHPDLPGTRPTGAPDADPLFDQVFDAVRSAPATRAEITGEGDPARVMAVSRAVRALGSIIGETTAHELGHSFGMAQPYGPPTVYHNDFDGEGCLMDAGGDRPLGERMQESGFSPTMLCYEQPDYMSEILGR